VLLGVKVEIDFTTTSLPTIIRNITASINLRRKERGIDTQHKECLATFLQVRLPPRNMTLLLPQQHVYCY
jgi:hypothetical protein